MARSTNRGKRTLAKSPPKSAPKSAAKTEHKLVVPYGEEGYDPEKDPLFMGYSSGTAYMTYQANRLGKKEEDIGPYDFYTDRATGLRPAEKEKPKGGSFTDLDMDDVEKCTLPPLAIWKGGQYLLDLVARPNFKEVIFPNLPYKLQRDMEDVEPVRWQNLLWYYWVTSGEGTPGNFAYRVYELPNAVAKQATPKHPLMWPESDKRSKRTTTSYSSGYGSGGGYGGGLGRKTVSTPSTPAAPKAPSMPAGVRMRCVCGHWFKMDDLAGHSQVCPALEENGESDWAMMCIAECGCHTLDDVCKCKPGFPRPAKEVEAKEGEAATQEGGDTPEAEPSEVQLAVTS